MFRLMQLKALRLCPIPVVILPTPARKPYLDSELKIENINKFLKSGNTNLNKRSYSFLSTGHRGKWIFGSIHLDYLRVRSHPHLDYSHLIRPFWQTSDQNKKTSKKSKPDLPSIENTKRKRNLKNKIQINRK